MNALMRFLFIGSFQGDGGAERSVCIIARELRRKGHEADVFLIKAVNVSCFDQEMISLMSVSPYGEKGIWGTLKRLWIMVRLMRKADMVVSSSELTPTYIVALCAACLRKPLISEVRVNLSSWFRLRRSKIQKWGARFLYRRLPGVIRCVSKGVAMDLERQWGVDPFRIHTIYNPFDLEATKERIPSNSSLDHFYASTRPVVVAMGRLTKQKRFDLAIQAIEILRDEFALSVGLVIMGQGELEDNLKEMVKRKKLEAQVFFPGFVSTPGPYLAKASAFLSTSDYEGFGRAIVDALAVGCPVVARNCPSGPSEILENGVYGVLIPFNESAEHIAETLRSLLDDAARAESYRRSGPLRAASFGASKIATEFERLAEAEKRRGSYEKRKIKQQSEWACLLSRLSRHLVDGKGGGEDVPGVGDLAGRANVTPSSQLWAQSEALSQRIPAFSRHLRREHSDITTFKHSNNSMDFTIITPSFKQLDYLGCCIASVADQGTKGSETVGMCQSGNVAPLRAVSAGSLSYAGLAERLSVEHIVQDAGSPGIEEFAEKMAEHLLGKYGGERVSHLHTFELLHIRTAHGYTLRIFKEKDEGMYDAINKGLKRGTGKIRAYLNCDEQYLSGALDVVQEFLKNRLNVDVVLGDVIVVGTDGEAVCHRKMVKPGLAHTWTCHFGALTAGIFFREKLLHEGLLFDTSYRVVSDAEWFVRVLQSGKKVQPLRRTTSTFMESGENLGLSSAAKEERKRLDNSASLYFKALRPVWVLAHRVKRLWSGAHRSEDVSYGIYLPKQSVRKVFNAKRLRTTWPGRMLNF